MNKFRRNPGYAHGFRSGLEEKVAKELAALGVTIHYESETISYTKPARNSKYTPDFPLPNGIIVETKGRFVVEDRQKHILIKEQHPDLDIRFVFSNSNTKISKNSKTSYAMWCEKHGFIYADKSIPQEWINAPVCQKRLAALESARVKAK
ncbi:MULTISPECIES: endodeoxyribonuclease [unclassified Thioalkalivibrio]|uniref:endodeoxyribonuclease n=1 Tax=unclassified Thioalkalivibrio TaxID=2621013 RepID=UPI000361EFD7|nr:MULTISPECIES: endodeoxyribonuclease [unclassified Thioalkalivibrio]